MVSYKIEWKNSAKKELKSIDRRVISDIVSAVERLAEHPTPGDSRKLRGSERTYRIRVQDYRVIYAVDRDRVLIEVLRIGHRKEVYRQFTA